MRCVDNDGNVTIQATPTLTTNGRQGQGAAPGHTGPAIETNALEHAITGLTQGTAAAARFAWGLAQGFASAGLDTAAGLAHVATHPVATLHGLAHAVRHPVQTTRALWAGIHTTAQALASGDPHAWGRTSFDLLATVLGAGIASKAGTLTKTLGVTDDAARVAAKGGSKPVRRIYEHNPKHRDEPYTDARGRVISRAPRGDCQAMLDCSVQRKPTSPERIGVEPSTGHAVIFRRHLQQVMPDEIREFFHGFVP